MLLDKIYKFSDKNYELGGEAAVEVFSSDNNIVFNSNSASKPKSSSANTNIAGGSRDAARTMKVHAVHTTCYEQKTKVMGLKVRRSMLLAHML